MTNYVEIARQVMAAMALAADPKPEAPPVPPAVEWPESLRELASERATILGDAAAAEREVWLSWADWKAAALNRLFQEARRHGQSGPHHSGNRPAW